MRTSNLLAAALLASTAIHAAFASSAYTCTTFQYGSATYTNVTGINNKGEVVGTWANPGQASHAFLRNADGTMITLNSPSGSDEFTPAGINNSGQIAGPSFILNPDGSYIDIPPPAAPPGHTYYGTQITGINDKGELTGTISADFNEGIGTILVFIRGTDGQYRIIDQSGTGSYPSLITGPINDSDVVVEHTRYSDGYLLQPNGSKIPLLFPGIPFDSGSPGGSTYTGGLNNNNITAGSTNSDLATNLAFVRSLDGHYPDVVCAEATPNSLLTVRGINDSNVVAGVFFGAGSAPGLDELGFIATPTGVFPHVQLSNQSWSFAAHPTGETSGIGRIFISNSGPVDLHIPVLYIGTTGQSTDHTGSFQITHSNCAPVPEGPPNLPEISPGSSCFVEFQFTPQASGWQTAAIYIPDDAPDSPQVVKIGGTGIGSVLQLSNTSWTFAAHKVGEVSGPGVIYAYNAGPGTITFSSSQIVEAGRPSDFYLINNTCGSSLAPYKACLLAFNFHPSTPGQQTASLNLNDNSAHGPVQIPLYGYGY